MGVNSATATSRRGYLSQLELKQFANIDITNATETDDQISQAEEIIDAYIKRASKFVRYQVEGIATSGNSGKTTLVDTSPDSPFNQDNDYWKGCEVEIVGGTNEGERRKITSYDKTTKTITVDSAFTSQVDTTTAYAIYQLGLFPRIEDVHHISNTYYKRIPEAIKRAVAAQVEFIIEKGESYFKGGAEFKRERIDDYEYERADGSGGLTEAMISPKARQFLRGFVKRIGVLQADNPTNL
jgi:hypothetical protein